MNILLNQGIVQRLVRQKGVKDEHFVEPGHCSTIGSTKGGKR